MQAALSGDLKLFVVKLDGVNGAVLKSFTCFSPQRRSSEKISPSLLLFQPVLFPDPPRLSGAQVFLIDLCLNPDLSFSFLCCSYSREDFFPFPVGREATGGSFRLYVFLFVCSSAGHGSHLSDPFRFSKGAYFKP